MKKAMAGGVLAVLAFVAFVPQAEAVVGKVGTGGGDEIFVGCVDTGAGYRLQWCLNGGISQIFTSWTMSDDVWVAGDDGSDFIQVTYKNNAYFDNLDCGDGTNRNWGPPNFNGHYLDVYGENDGDTVFGSAGDTWATGDLGSDYVKNYGSIGHTYGDENDDDVISASTGGSETLSGGSGNDCVDDRTDTWSSFLCGTGTDYGTSQPAGASCDFLIGCCDILSCGFSAPEAEGGDSGESDGGGGGAEGRGARH